MYEDRLNPAPVGLEYVGVEAEAFRAWELGGIELDRGVSRDEIGNIIVGHGVLPLRHAESEGLPWIVDECHPKAKHLAKPENRRTIYRRVVTAAIELLLYTGCRLSEVLGFRWDRIDFEMGTITIAETKAGQPAGGGG